MVSLSKLERIAKATDARERREESDTAAAKLAANIDVEADLSSNESVDPSPLNTPPPSDFEDIDEE